MAEVKFNQNKLEVLTEIFGQIFFSIGQYDVDSSGEAYIEVISNLNEYRRLKDVNTDINTNIWDIEINKRLSLYSGFEEIPRV
jgi:hypothetical protein